MYPRTWYEPLLDDPPPEPRHRRDELPESGVSRAKAFAGLRRRLGGALIALGRYIAPELRPRPVRRQAANHR